MTERYVIFGWEATFDNDNKEVLYWSTTDGWVGLSNATTFTKKQKDKYRLLPDDGVWIQLPK